MIKFVNMCDKEIVLLNASGKVMVKLKPQKTTLTTQESMCELEGIRYKKGKIKVIEKKVDLINLPPREKDTYYIIPYVKALVLKEYRNDILTLGDKVVKDGKTIGYKSLIKVVL